MSELNAEITTQDLLNAAQRAGFSVSEHKLERWRRLGLLPRPVSRPGRGRGRGRVGLYPPGTTEQLLALLRISLGDRRTSRWGWHLWGEGYDVVRFVRPRVIAYFSDFERSVLDTLEKFEEGDPDNLIEQSPHVHLNRAGDAMRRRVGPDRYPTVVRMISELLAGSFSGGWLEEDDRDILARLSGGHKRGSTPPLAEQIATFRALDLLHVPEIRAAAEAASDEELIRVRNDVLTFLNLLPGRIPLTPGIYMIGFAVLKGSKRIADFVERLRNDPSLAEKKVEALAGLQAARARFGEREHET